MTMKIIFEVIYFDEPNKGKIFNFLSMYELFSESTTKNEENAELSEKRENTNAQKVSILRKDEAFASAKKSSHSPARGAYPTLNKNKGDKYSIIKDAIAIVGGGQNDARVQKNWRNYIIV